KHGTLLSRSARRFLEAFGCGPQSRPWSPRLVPQSAGVSYAELPCRPFAPQSSRAEAAHSASWARSAWFRIALSMSGGGSAPSELTLCDRRDECAVLDRLLEAAR